MTIAMVKLADLAYHDFPQPDGDAPRVAEHVDFAKRTLYREVGLDPVALPQLEAPLAHALPATVG